MIAWICVTVALFAGVLLTNNQGGNDETVKVLMRDAVMHENDHINLFGIAEVNPAFVSAMVVTVSLLFIAALIRIFIIPRFKFVPGKIQLMIEELVGLFSELAKSNSPKHNGFLGAYLFGAGIYIFLGTIFELFGFQAVTVSGHSISLPAPLSDINAAISLGCLSYLVILSGGIIGNGWKGLGNALKDFSLPVSMSFRLFGALLSGLLVTELVYYYINLSFVLPIAIGVMFTLLHALIQTYVLTMITSMSYGEVAH